MEHMNPIPNDATIGLAERLADRAGAVIVPYFRAGLDADDKSDGSPVTRADRAAEEAMRAILSEAAPDHGIIGEEFGRTRDDAEFVWVLDPIDGTKAFIAGKPLFVILIALLHQGRPVLGLIDQPVTRERWVGAAGRPTLFCGPVPGAPRSSASPARTRACSGLPSARFSSTGPQYFKEPELRAVEAVRARTKLTSWGGDGYQYGLVASGCLDLVIEAGLAIHDWAALEPVIAGAGGVVTDWEGRPLDTSSGGRVVAAGDRRCHAEAIEALARHGGDQQQRAPVE
jgi:histidinol phosphatase-like enzyme (inositol monophosphatase family)